MVNDVDQGCSSLDICLGHITRAANSRDHDGSLPEGEGQGALVSSQGGKGDVSSLGALDRRNASSGGEDRGNNVVGQDLVQGERGRGGSVMREEITMNINELKIFHLSPFQYDTVTRCSSPCQGWWGQTG